MIVPSLSRSTPGLITALTPLKILTTRNDTRRVVTAIAGAYDNGYIIAAQVQVPEQRRRDVTHGASVPGLDAARASPDKANVLPWSIVQTFGEGARAENAEQPHG
jgi:hypothetical protein